MVHITTWAVAAIAAGAIGAQANAIGNKKSEGSTVQLDSGLVQGGKCPHPPARLFQGVPLYADIYVPPTASADSALPVKVFAYGGGNEGDAVTYPLYDACNLATDAIVVSFNYRLGLFGFLSFADADVKGNMAIQDYLAALRWVKANIAAFGGDSSKIMLFGQSAGADDAFVVSTLPEAKELLSSVILESGGGQDMAPYTVAQHTGASYAKALGCDSSDLDCLQSKSAKELLAAIENTADLQQLPPISSVFNVDLPGLPSLTAVTLDGEIIKEEPLKTGSQVPIIAGFASSDSTLFTIPLYYSSGAPITEKSYTQFLDSWGPAGKEIGKKYPLSLFNTSSSTEYAVVAAVSHITTVSTYTCLSYKTLRAAKAAGTAAYAYIFDKTPTCPWLVVEGMGFPGCDDPPKCTIRNVFGPTHTAELPLVFANLNRQPFGTGNCTFSDAEVKLSKTLVEAWTAMAASGNPATERQAWPKFNACDNRGLHFGDETMVQELDYSECKFWDSVWSELGGVFVPRPAKSSCKGGSCHT